MSTSQVKITEVKALLEEFEETQDVGLLVCELRKLVGLPLTTSYHQNCSSVNEEGSDYYGIIRT